MRFIAARFYLIPFLVSVTVAIGCRTAEAAPASPDTIRAWIQGGRIAEADTSARELMAERTRKFGAESLEVADALDLLVEALWRAAKGAKTESRDLAERAVRIKAKSLHSSDVGLALSRFNLAQVLRQSGDYAEARTNLEQALAAQRTALGPENLTVAQTTVALGDVVWSLGDLQAGRKLLEEALAIQERKLSPEDPLIADTVVDLASLLTDLGDYENAGRLHERGLRLRERALGPDNPQVANSLNNLGRLQYQMGDYAGARTSFERAASILARALGPGDRRLGYTLTFMGLVLQGTGDYEAARDTLERALDIRLKALGPNHMMVATTLLSLADVQTSLGNYAQSKDLYERALAIRERRTGPKDEGVAAILEGLALALAELGSAEAADSAAARSIAILEEVVGPKHHAFAQGLANAATVHFYRGDAAGAKALLQRALAIDAEVLGSGHPEIAKTEGLLARVHLASGDTAAALSSALRAEQIAREHLRLTGRALSGREALQYASTRTNGLGIALKIAERGLPDSLLRHVFDTVIRSRAVVLDEMARRHHVEQDADSVAVRLRAELEARARRHSNLIVGGSSDEGQDYREELERSRREMEVAERALADHSRAYRNDQAFASVGLDDVASALPQASTLIAYVRYAAPPSGFRASEPEAESYGAFVLHGATVRFAPLDRGDRIEGMVNRWCEEAGRGVLRPGRSSSEKLASYRKVALSLRRLIWDPLDLRRYASQRVFIVPDGDLNLVGFAALPLNRGYLIETGPLIQYLSAERDLVMGPPSAEGASLLAFGGPDFDAVQPFASLSSQTPRSKSDDRMAQHASGHTPYRGRRASCAGFKSVHFDPLPATKEEAREVAGLWHRGHPAHEQKVHPTGSDGTSPDGRTASVLLGADATESAFKTMAPQAGVLHLATHGFFLDGGCHWSAVPARGMGRVEGFAKSERPAPKEPTMPSKAAKPSKRPPVSENPLLLSGVALAGANHRDAATGSEEDGILTAEEIAAMDLSGVRLAVLSACDTGAGKATSGEGVLGMRRAFEIAGAGTLVMSLWSVDDEATRVWMKSFYEATFQRGIPPAEAAREASRRILRDRRSHHAETHPFYWGGFVVAGDWR